MRPAVFVLGALAIASGLGAQTTAERQPQLGQPGKDVIWLPTHRVLVEKMLDMAQVTPQDFLIDLGSGDGRVVIAAARRGARALGVEYDPDLVDLSKRNAATQRVADKATFVRADLFQVDLSKATVVTLYLRLDLNLKLRPKLLALEPGTRIVSNTFSMDDWEPDDVWLGDRKCANCSAFMWIVPARVQGTWRLPEDDMTLTQTLQTVTGTLRTGTAIPIRSRSRQAPSAIAAASATKSSRERLRRARTSCAGPPRAPDSSADWWERVTRTGLEAARSRRG
jgi:hypothetical protein